MGVTLSEHKQRSNDVSFLHSDIGAMCPCFRVRVTRKYSKKLPRFACPFVLGGEVGFGFLYLLADISGKLFLLFGN